MDILPDDAPAPRLCHLIKWPDFDGYGFNLHAERSNPGQFIGKIDDDSPAQMAGLREGDRIVEVNGVNISNENHRQVVERIKSDPKETKLLVVDLETDAWYREQDIVIKSSQINVVYIKTPVPRPEPDSPRAKFHQPQQSDDQSRTEARSEGGTSSLETSDFNDDSLEQQHRRAGSSGQPSPNPTAASNVVEPPMSPDSGRGPDDEDSNTYLASGSDVLTVEAEINRQSPQIVKQLACYEDSDSVGGHASEANKKEEEKPISIRNAANPPEEIGGHAKIDNETMQPDSLNCDAKQQQDEKQPLQKQDEKQEEEEQLKTRPKLGQTITSNELADAAATNKQVSSVTSEPEMRTEIACFISPSDCAF